MFNFLKRLGGLGCGMGCGTHGHEHNPPEEEQKEHPHIQNPPEGKREEQKGSGKRSSGCCH